MTDLTIPNGEFSFTRLEKVIFGAGAIAKLGAELDRRGIKRVVIATGKSLGASPLLARVTDAIGPRLAGVYKGISQHVPAGTVRGLIAELKRTDADCVISFGGGSPIAACKVAVASILNGRDMTLEGGKLDWALAFAPHESKDAIVHIAVPTTLSAGEYTPAGGVTNEETRRKAGVIDARIQART